MKNVFLPSVNSSQSFVSILLSTNLIPVLFLYYLFYLIIAVILVTTFETFFVDMMKDMKFTRALEQVTLILGFMYSIWVTLYLKGYSSLAGKFDNFLVSIEKFSNRFFTLVVPFHECTKNHNHDKDDQKIILVKIIDIMEQVRDTCLVLLSKGYSLFSDQEPDYLEGYHSSIRKIVHNYEDSTDIINLMNKLQSNLLIQMKLMEDNIKYLSGGDIGLLHKDLDNIRDLYREIESSMRVNEPGLFTKIIFTSLMVYFILWVPYVQWIILGATATIFIFPVVMMMLTILVIVREWLGDAFDKRRPISYMNFYTWRQRSYARVLSYFLETIYEFQDKNMFVNNQQICADQIWHNLSLLKIRYQIQQQHQQQISIPLLQFYFQTFGKINKMKCESLRSSSSLLLQDPSPYIAPIHKQSKYVVSTSYTNDINPTFMLFNNGLQNLLPEIVEEQQNNGSMDG